MAIIPSGNGDIEKLKKYFPEHDVKIDKVYKRCLEYIELDNYVRLGQVIKQELGISEPAAFYKEIAFKLTKDGKYLLQSHIPDVTDWVITHDPNYAMSESVRNTNDSVIRTNKHLRNTGWITVGVSAIAALFAVLAFFKDDSKLQQQTHKLLQQKLLQLDSIQQIQKGIGSSLETMAKIDSLRNAKSLNDSGKH